MKRLAAALAAFGPMGVFAIAMLDSAGLPLPAVLDVLLLSTSAINPRAAYLSAVLATIGSLIGSFFLFSIARKGGQAYLSKHMTSDRALRFQEWFSRYGMITVFVPLLLPIPLPVKIFVVSAGALGVRPWQFIATVAAARVPRYFGLAYMGATLGPNAAPWLEAHAWHIAGLALLIVVALYLFIRWADRKPQAV